MKKLTKMQQKDKGIENIKETKRFGGKKEKV